MKQLSMFSLEELPANHSQSQVSEKEWKTLVATWPLNSVALLTRQNPSGLFGKMSPASCQVTEEKILVPSSGRWGNSGMGSLTEFLTLNTLELHKDAEESFLSDTLEIGDLPQRFYLSPKACAGILRRAEVRGKNLPERLREALLTTVSQENGGTEDKQPLV